MKHEAFWRTVSWQSIAFSITLIVGRAYYGDWSISPVAGFLFFVLPPLFYLHERLWEVKRK